MNLPDRTLPGHWVREAITQYENRLVRYAARVTGDMETARDVVQETFARLCGQEPASLNGRLLPWLYTVCRNRAIECRRKDRRMQAIGDIAFDTMTDGRDGPSETLERRETVGGMLAILAKLPESQQEVLRLKFQEGLSYKEISEVTGHSVSNVGVLLHTAIKKLRERMSVAPASCR